MILLVETPSSYTQERAYIAQVVFGEFLGVAFRLSQSDRRRLLIRSDQAPGRLILPDVLFGTPEARWLKPESLPARPLSVWDSHALSPDIRLSHRQVPVIYGEADSGGSESAAGEVRLPIDIFGSAFFMLTRYEEVAVHTRDAHDRFPAASSLARQEGFLDRPIINEYVEILWAAMKRLWPGIQRKARRFTIDLSHDVDRPFKYYFRPLADTLTEIARDLARDKHPASAWRAIYDCLAVKGGNLARDPFNTFDLIMDRSERLGITSTFYFMTGNTGGAIDADYEMLHPEMVGLLTRIYRRGHRIGLHPSYHTYRSPEQTRREFAALLSVLERLGVEQASHRARQHFLRWSTPGTFQNLEDAGIDFDSTLGYADEIGFRCGSCYAFSTFNLFSRKHLRLTEVPLHIMDDTLYAERFMGIRDPERLSSVVGDVLDTCRRFNGTFTLLVHNSFRLVHEMHAALGLAPR